MVTPGSGGDVDLDDASTRHERCRFLVGNRFLRLGPLSLLMDAAQFRRDGGVIVYDGHQRRQPPCFCANSVLGWPGGFNGGNGDSLGAGGSSL